MNPFKHRHEWEPCGHNPWGVPIEEFCRKCGGYRHHLWQDAPKPDDNAKWRNGKHPNRK